MSENVTPFDIFCWGVDYGQFLMEQEFSNNWADVVTCSITAEKTGMPTNYIPHRQPHNDKWLEVKKQGWINFKNYCKEKFGGI